MPWNSNPSDASEFFHGPERVPPNAVGPVLTSIGEHYIVDGVLGRGGMSTVYLCRDTRDERLVAVKVLRKELVSEIIIERFLREIAFASKLDHPRIPKVLESGLAVDLPYYAMTYVNGESLKRKLEREKQLALPEAIRIARDIITPTEYAHSRGIVHRDIKPDNILLANDGVYVLDFGIARAIVESGVDRLTSSGVGVGTPAYMSPEQALGDRNLDVRSDVYSLGCVLYEMIAGIPPFVGPTSQAIISRRFAALPPPLREVRDGVPAEVEDVVQRALARAPADRWPSVAAFGKALEALRTDAGTVAFQRPMAGPRRLAVRRIGAAAFVLAVAAAGVVAWSQGHSRTFKNAQDALQRWEFDNAERDLRLAIAADSTNAPAHLWLAQLLMLKGKPASDWKPFVSYAAHHRAKLDVLDNKRSDALSAFSVENLAQACRDFATLSTFVDFTAELALGDCLLADSAVVSDSKSPSRYRFRASHHMAETLYEQLLSRNRLNVAAYKQLMPRLEKLLPIDLNQYRRGLGEGDRLNRFLAAPALNADTLAYVPYPIRSVGPGWRSQNLGSAQAAVARNRERLLTLLTQWRRLDSDNPNVRGSLARVLESRAETADGDMNAFYEVRLARELAASQADTPENYLRQLRLARNHVSIYVRMSRFNEAGILADSISRQPRRQGLDPGAAEEVADILSMMAALRGRGLQVIELQRPASAHFSVLLPNGHVATLPARLGADANRLNVYADFGGPRDSLLAVFSRLSANLGSASTSGNAQALRQAVFSRALLLAAPIIGPDPALSLGPTSDLLIGALKELARRDLRASRNRLDSLAALRSRFAAGQVTIDELYLESWLRAASGDTAVAERQLENSLRGLPATLRTLRSPGLAASLVHAMALFAELSNATGKRETARKWAASVLALWGQGDVTTAATVKRMQQIEALQTAH